MGFVISFSFHVYISILMAEAGMGTRLGDGSQLGLETTVFGPGNWLSFEARPGESEQTVALIAATESSWEPFSGRERVL